LDIALDILLWNGALKDGDRRHVAGQLRQIGHRVYSVQEKRVKVGIETEIGGHHVL